MQHLLRWSLIGLAVSSFVACGGSKQQQQQASSPNQQQVALSPQEQQQLEQASNEQQQFNQQQKAEKDKAREWYSSSSTCAAQIPEVFISVQDIVDGAKVMYYTTNLAYIDPLRNNVTSQLQGGSDQARASGGTPMSSGGELPMVSIETNQNPDGLTVIYKASDSNDADRVRQLVREDVHHQQLGHCSMLRAPEGADIKNRSQ